MLLVGEMDEDMSVGVEYLGLADKSEVVVLLIDDGQVPCSGILEYLHDFLHRHVVLQDGLR